MKRSASDLICDTLRALGAKTVFGMAGSQNLPLFEALRSSGLRTIASTSELAASFAANGYFRASGQVGVLMTIPGPGFMFALNGIAEARSDSAGLLLITSSAAGESDRKFQHQQLDLNGVGSHLFKKIYDVEQIEHLVPAICQAYQCAGSGEPGPVMVHLRRRVYREFAAALPIHPLPQRPEAPPRLSPEIVNRVCDARRPLIFIGQGCASAAGELLRLAERIHAPVMCTCSGRGVLPDSHPQALVFDYCLGGMAEAHACVDACDLVLAIGCKLSHNGSGGFSLRIEKEKLIHVDASEEVLGANYPARYEIVSDAASFIMSLLDALKERRSESRWTQPEIQSWQDRLKADARRATRRFPLIQAGRPVSCEFFFESMRRALPRNACLVTDSGYHQMIARQLFRVEAARGLIAPSDWQSMGFGIPAAVGAALAAPDRKVVALVGDGGMAITGMELLTAVREGIDLLVIVFNDGYLGLIRKSQIEKYGREHGVNLQNPDFEMMANSLGAGYFALSGPVDAVLKECFNARGVNILEVFLSDTFSIHTSRLKGLSINTVRKTIPPSWIHRMKRLLMERA